MTAEYDTYRAAYATADNLHNANVVASRATRETAIRAAELVRLASDPARSSNAAHATFAAAAAAAEAAHKSTSAASAAVRNATIQQSWLTYRNSVGWQGWPGAPSMAVA